MRWIIPIMGALLLTGCASTTVDQVPTTVVQQYFTAWSNQEYAIMYELVTDGFKQIEPTATTLQSFSQEQQRLLQQAGDITILQAKTTVNDGSQAKVDYRIEMALPEGPKQFTGTYTLKNTPEGWKLIHPYGEKADLS
jgi:hypothetical protein